MNIDRRAGSSVSTDETMTENNCFGIKHDKALDSNANVSAARGYFVVMKQTKYCPIERENFIEANSSIEWIGADKRGRSNELFA